MYPAIADCDFGSMFTHSSDVEQYLVFSCSQFQGAMLFRDSALLDRIFRAFDTNDDGFISFSEYVACLSIISNKATQEDKLKCTFFRLRGNISLPTTKI